MTREEEDEHVDGLVRKISRDRVLRRIAAFALLALALGAMGWALVSTAENNTRLADLEEDAQSSDRAATSVAQEKQDQARSILALCEDGAIKQDAAGKQACADAEEAAGEDPAEKIQAVKGRGITDAQCGSDGRWTITYTDGETDDAGPCLAESPEQPTPTPTPTGDPENTTEGSP